MSTGEIQIVNNVASLLDCFTTQQPELGVREAARLLNLSSSTVGRLLVAMKEAGMLTQNPTNRSYRLAGRVLAWAGVYSATFDLRQRAMPAIKELYITTQETISLYIMEGDERMCIERMESPQNVRIVARLGRRLPLYAGSAGKLLLAYLPEVRSEEIIRHTDFKPLTPHTIIDPVGLRQELLKIRQEGYAFSSGEWEAEAAGVAAPVFDQNGEIVAALTISGPVQRFTPAVVDRYIGEVTRIAAQISKELGCPIQPNQVVKEFQMILFDQIAAQLPEWRERVNRLKKDHGSFKVGDVTIDQIYSGIRDVQIQVSDISYVDPHEGIRLRGYTIPEVMALLPKAEGSSFPLAGGLYYLLMVDAIPNQAQAQAVEDEWKRRSAVPGQVYDVIRAMPPETHPMTLFSQAILALQPESAFARRYTRGMQKVDYWDAYLEDSLNLTAKLPTIAAFIYNYRYRGGVDSCTNPMIDWSADFACMIDKANAEYKDMSRLFFVLHSDHEGANVSAHTAHLVGSALSDVYYSCSAGINGLAGPLHGLANQECLLYLLGVQEHFKGVLPTKEQYAAYAWEQLQAGKVIPGYGHAVLRVTDPRFTAQLEFGKKYFPDDPLYRLVNIVYETLPGVLNRYGKVKNPWPNVDAINGTMQYHYGVREIEFYTVLFGVSRILGLTAHLVWSRALGKPIERPKSLTTHMLEEMVVEEKV